MMYLSQFLADLDATKINIISNESLKANPDEYTPLAAIKVELLALDNVLDDFSAPHSKLLKGVSQSVLG